MFENTFWLGLETDIVFSDDTRSQKVEILQKMKCSSNDRWGRRTILVPCKLS